MGLYTARFYQDVRESSRQSARELVPLLLDLVTPKSVIDVGCGQGTWLSVFREYGVEEILGVDGSWVDTESLEIPKECFIPCDLTEPWRTGRQFDLVVSLEVAEHLAAEYADTFVDTLTRLGPVIAFSAAIPRQGGTHHVNEQWPDYWARFFRARGYQTLDCVRRKLWSNTNIGHVYAQNTVLYAKSERLESDPRLAMECEQAEGSPLALIHPQHYLNLIRETERLHRTLVELGDLVAPGDAFILVDDEKLAPVVTAGRRAIPFLEREGAYWGRPSDSDTAIRELERLRRSGAAFIVFAWPAFWWLDYYSEFGRYLRSHFRCVLENERLIAFELFG